MEAPFRTVRDGDVGEEASQPVAPCVAGSPEEIARATATMSGMDFHRVTVNSHQMGGVQCLRGLRIPVATIVALVAEGQAPNDILALYPDLEAEDIREALLFAADAVRERALPLAAGE